MWIANWFAFGQLGFYLLRVTRGAHSPNLQVVITHASNVYSQHLFGTSTKNEWNIQNAI